MASQASFEVDNSTLTINQGEPIGRGSYGLICTAKYGEVECVAKYFDGALLEPWDLEDFGESGLERIFQQECLFLAKFKHPNIVQGLGVTTDPSSGNEVLLMERMESNLTTILERLSDDFSVQYCSQINICYDLSLALSYIHSQGIIHRDVSSNNVLMKGMIAKLTDFGVSVHNDDQGEYRNMECPGNIAYMPPEARKAPYTYGYKLDCFSMGVLIIQIITKKSPTYKFEDTHIHETDRRKEDIDLIKHNHPLLQIAIHCLEDLDTRRPSSVELHEMLSLLKQDTFYQFQQQQQHLKRKDGFWKDEEALYTLIETGHLPAGSSGYCSAETYFPDRNVELKKTCQVIG